MVVFDTTFLLHLVDPHALPPLDPSTSVPVSSAYQRVKFLVNELNERHEKIIVPTPAIAELLIVAEKAGAAYLDSFSRAAFFQVEPFDIRAAVELAIMTASSIKDGDKKAGSTATAAKVKFDRQITAIAKVNGGSLIYTDDENLTKFANGQGISTTALWELPLPPEEPQLDLLKTDMAEAPEPAPDDDDGQEVDEE